MNPKQKSLQRLLDEVVIPESDCGNLGPNRSTILEMVNREQARRRRTKTILGTATSAGICAFVALLFILQPRPLQQPSLAKATAEVAPSPPPPTTISIHEVNDKELLELLKDTPVALMEWPDGKRTLLVVAR